LKAKEKLTMQPIIKRAAGALLVLITALAGLAPAAVPAQAASVTVNLCASTGSITMPGGTVVPVWGFVTNPGTCAPGMISSANFPGPLLAVNEGDVVTVNLANALPAGHTLDFEIPGVTFAPGLTNGSAPITFTASVAGTHVYQSGGDAGRQEAMGLYGALIVRPLTAGQAYDDPATAYDVEATLVLSQVDPNFNAAPDSFNMHDYLATYWLINGKAYPGTAPISAAGGQKVLLRYVNAGYDNTTMALLGMHERVVARGARLLNNPFLAAAETIPAGGTEDAIATVPTTAPPGANGFPIYNRQLHVTNGSTAALDYQTPGGMMTFIQPTGGGVDQPPTVNAGTDQTIALPASANLDGTVTDDGLSPLTTLWTQTSGPGSVTFGNAGLVDTTASFSAAGSYVLRLTATDGTGSVFDEVTITVNPAATTMHIGAMSGSATNTTGMGSTYTAFVVTTVHDSNHAPLAGVSVTGAWTTGTGSITGATTSCVTNGLGQCTVQATHSRTPGNSSNYLTFTVSNLTLATYTYVSADNDVPDNVTVPRQ
jgi:FtsP/CotA-like multicopper oxidase with cupredoxin domain